VRKIIEPLGISEIGILAAKDFLNRLKNSNPDEVQRLIGIKNPENFLTDIVGPGGGIEIPTVPLILSLITQASILPWKEIWGVFDDTVSHGKLDFRAVLSADTMEGDLKAGVCPIPFYDFSEDDVATFTAGDPEAAQLVLKRLGIYQYFFPPADHLALGIVEQGLSVESTVIEATSFAPALGHPFGESEIIPTATDMIATLEQLKDIGYVAEGEHGLAVTETGRTIRSTVKFKPRESVITKLLNRFSVSASYFT